MRSCLEAGHAGTLPRALHLEVNDGGAKTRVAMIATYRCKGSEPSRGVSTPLVSLAITCLSQVHSKIVSASQANCKFHQLSCSYP